MCRNSDTIKCTYVCDEVYYRKEVSLIDVYVTTIEDKRLLSQVLSKLTYPASIMHLRRIYKGLLLLGPIDGFDDNNATDVLTELNCKYELKTTKVPSCVPLTRIQHDFCQLHWSVRFRHNGELEEKLAGTYFSNSTLQLLQQMMENARDSDGCIITDNMYQILGKASESKMSKEEPLKHPFMRAFDNLTQAHLVALKRSAIGDQYYGTDCIVFVYDEPCPMCAMGMTHARIKTVFFKNPSSKGAFVTTCQLHLKPQLNHHYEVYQLEY